MINYDRFKLGDVIVIVDNNHYNSSILDKDLTVDRLDQDGIPRVSYVNEKGEDDLDFVEDVDCELKIIANSPLGKALR